jgi:signal transduction histidine kinase
VLGAKLARRIVLPLLVAVAALFALLGAVAVRISSARVEAELEEKATRIAETLGGIPQLHPEILDALADLMDVGLLIGPHAAGKGLEGVDASRLQPTRTPGEPWEQSVGGRDYVVIERTAPRHGRCLILTEEERIAGRQHDVLMPIAVAGAVGLLVALLFGLFVARAIARPVRRLADSVRGFGEGRYEGGVGDRGPGEIGELQDAFVAMVEAIRAGEAKLRESERFAALGRLAGGIAHELRNPLTAIRMAAETGMTDGEARRIALAEIDRLDRTLRELLDFVRPRKPRLREVDARGLLEGVAALLRPQCEHLRVRLETEAPLGLALVADEDRVKQALLNLVLNGAQAQPRGGVVRMRARGGPGAVILEVEDEGGGIPEKVMGSLLQPFVTTKEGGIGLGLAVVAQVAEEHGARLDFRTGQGGTTFTLVFPAPQSPSPSP